MGEGMTHVARSPYLLGICGFMLLHSVTSTLVYFQQADLALEIPPVLQQRLARLPHVGVADPHLGLVREAVEEGIGGVLAATDRRYRFSQKKRVSVPVPA